MLTKGHDFLCSILVCLGLYCVCKSENICLSAFVFKLSTGWAYYSHTTVYVSMCVHPLATDLFDNCVRQCHYIIIMSFHYIIILLCYDIMLSLHHVMTPLHYDIMLWCHNFVMLLCHYIMMLWHYVLTLWCHNILTLLPYDFNPLWCHYLTLWHNFMMIFYDDNMLWFH